MADRAVLRGVKMAPEALSCESPVQVCHLGFAYGLRIVVTDSVSGTPLVGPDAVVEIRDGAYVDTLEQMSPTEYLGAGERAGSYAITAQRPGYRVWRRQRTGRLHVRMAALRRGVGQSAMVTARAYANHDAPSAPTRHRTRRHDEVHRHHDEREPVVRAPRGPRNGRT
jgi:hypothetical protein